MPAGHVWHAALDVVVQALEVNWPAGQLVQDRHALVSEAMEYVDNNSRPWISSSPKFIILLLPVNWFTVHPKNR